MKIRNIAFVVLAVGVSCGLTAQTSSTETRVVRNPKKIERRIILRSGEPGMRGEMGKWWRDTEISKKLQLSDGQIQQLDQIFFDHRVKLIDHGAEMEKQDMKLQSLLDADQPDEGQIGSQVDLVLAARGKLEREYTFMNLDLRKVLSLDQWRQLKAVRSERDGDNVIYLHRKLDGPGAGPMLPPLPPDSEGEAPIPNL
ncbi:MAG: periplasmic heavy metal sensor [Acidobacteria bacterium]|nr:periplasmic heavy metal sensor [Acidobacteriota bacterium]